MEPASTLESEPESSGRRGWNQSRRKYRPRGQDRRSTNCPPPSLVETVDSAFDAEGIASDVVDPVAARRSAMVDPVGVLEPSTRLESEPASWLGPELELKPASALESEPELEW